MKNKLIVIITTFLILTGWANANPQHQSKKTDDKLLAIQELAKDVKALYNIINPGAAPSEIDVTIVVKEKTDTGQQTKTMIDIRNLHKYLLQQRSNNSSSRCIKISKEVVK